MFKLIGLQSVNFTSNNGETICGTNIWVAYSDENVTGLKSQKFFLKKEIQLPEVKPNDNLRLTFDMKGRVISVEKA